jgi:signal transduction histidine kinase
MSHELRTPLNAIRGYAELLALGVYGGVTDAQRDALARITHSERHLLGLITEILDFARLETGRARYNLADVPLGEVLAEAHALVDPQLRGKGLAFARDGCACEGVVVRADAGKARQIVLNLLSNALKFTAAGGRVELRCRAEPTMAVVEVVDSGAGIPAAELERVFEPFVQLARGRTNAVTGSGLGLAISRELARGMGGDLTAESTVGAGSLFRLTLPRI